MGEALLLSRTAVINPHVFENGFYVTVHFVAFDRQFRIEGEETRFDIEISIGSEKIAHGRHLSILNSHIDIEIRIHRFWPEGAGHLSIARSHELALQFERCRTLGDLIAEVSQVCFHLIDREAVIGLGRPVYVPEIACFNPEHIYPDLRGGLVTQFFCSAHNLPDPFLFRGHSLRKVEIINVSPVNVQILQVDYSDTGVIFQGSLCRQSPPSDGNIVAVMIGLK